MSDKPERACEGCWSEASGRQLTRLGQGGRTVLFEDVAAVEVTVVVEVVVDRGVDGGEFLQGLDVLGARNTRLAGLHRDRPAGVRAGGRTSSDLPQSRCTSCIGEQLYVDSPPLGVTKLRDWVRASCQDIGRRYTSELQLSGHHSK